MDDKCFQWHHRTIRHIDSSRDDHEPYCTAHEFGYSGTQYDGLSFCDAVAQSREEAEWIVEAFSVEPVIEVDEVDFEVDEYGFPSYTKFQWLNRTVPTTKEK